MDKNNEIAELLKDISEDGGVFEMAEGIRERIDAALAALQAEPVGLADYDAGLLNDFGGGNVEWWQDYIRAEVGRTNDFWRDQVGGITPQPAKGYNLSRESPEVITLTTPDSEIAFYAKAHDNRLYKFMEAMLAAAPAAGEGEK